MLCAEPAGKEESAGKEGGLCAWGHAHVRARARGYVLQGHAKSRDPVAGDKFGVRPLLLSIPHPLLVILVEPRS